MFSRRRYKNKSKLKTIKDNVSKYNLIFILHEYGVHWWINIFVKLKNDSYPLNESYPLITLDSIIDKKTNSILQIKIYYKISLI